MKDILLPIVYHGRQFAVSKSEPALLHEQVSDETMFTRVGECGRFLCIYTRLQGLVSAGEAPRILIGCRRSMQEDYKLDQPFEVETSSTCWKCLCDAAAQLHKQKCELTKSCKEILSTNV